MSSTEPINTQLPAGTPTKGEVRLREGAKALAVRDGTVLLVKERHRDGSVFWTLPGGGKQPGESAVETLQRELDEELACQGHIGEAVGTFLYPHQSSGRISRYEVFACSIDGTHEPAITHGIYDSAWFPPEELPTQLLPQVRTVVGQQLSPTVEKR